MPASWPWVRGGAILVKRGVGPPFDTGEKAMSSLNALSRELEQLVARTAPAVVGAYVNGLFHQLFFGVSKH